MRGDSVVGCSEANPKEAGSEAMSDRYHLIRARVNLAKQAPMSDEAILALGMLLNEDIPWLIEQRDTEAEDVADLLWKIDEVLQPRIEELEAENARLQKERDTFAFRLSRVDEMIEGASEKVTKLMAHARNYATTEMEEVP